MSGPGRPVDEARVEQIARRVAERAQRADLTRQLEDLKGRLRDLDNEDRRRGLAAERDLRARRGEQGGG